MSLELTPFFIAGPDHSAAVARTVAYNACGGNQGFAGSRDFHLTQTPTPSENVQILGGAYTILNTNDDYQAYTGRSTGAVEIPIPASGSTGSKTWYVGLQIDDPEYPFTEGPAEGEENLFEYVKFKVRSSNSGENGKPWLPIAKIVVPANEATIRNSYITSLRYLANPREKNIIIPNPIVTGDTGIELNSRSAFPDGEWFPNVGGNDDNGRYTLDVPEWATKAQVRCEWLGIYYKSNPGAGMCWVSFGPEGGSNSPKWYTQGFGWNSGDGITVTNWIVADEINVRSEWRGDTLSFYPRANKTTDSSYPGEVGLSPRSGMNFEIRFLEEPDVSFDY